MKIDEVLTMGGFNSMVGPGTTISTQVVQPRTIQAMNPEQSGPEYEKAKNSQKEQPTIATDVYNDRDLEFIKNPYEKDEELSKKLQKTIFAVDNKEIAKINIGYKEFSKSIDKEVEKEEPKNHLRQKSLK